MSEKEYKDKCESMFKRNTILIKENEILKNIISIILDKEDICYICQMKGQVLPACKCMEDSECLENMISLWSK